MVSNVIGIPQHWVLALSTRTASSKYSPLTRKNLSHFHHGHFSIHRLEELASQLSIQTPCSSTDLELCSVEELSQG